MSSIARNDLVLPEEILVKIFTHYALDVIDIDESDNYPPEEISSEFDIENVTGGLYHSRCTRQRVKMLVLSKRFLELLAPSIFPNVFYAIVPLCSTQYLKDFDSFETFIKEASYDNVPSLGFYRRRLKPKLSSGLQKDSSFDDSSHIRPNRPNGLPDHLLSIDERMKVRELLNVFENGRNLGDYEVLDVHFMTEKLGNSQQTLLRGYNTPGWPYFDAGRPPAATNAISTENNPDNGSIIDGLLSFCLRVMNNENSIMRRFVKSFTVDLLFLDEFQTRRMSQGTLFGSILGKYVQHERCFSIKPTPFKMFSNFFASKHFNIDGRLYHVDQDVLGMELYDRIQQLRNKFMKSYESTFPRGPERSHFFYQDEDWLCYRQLTLYSCFIDFFVKGERFKASRITSKTDLWLAFQNIFKDFRAETSDFGISKKITLADWDMNDLTSEQYSCCELTHEKFSRVFRFSSDEAQYVTTAQLTQLIEELVKATTVNSPKHTDTSLVAFSLKNKHINEAFEMIKPKIIVINKPAEGEDTVK